MEGVGRNDTPSALVANDPVAASVHSMGLDSSQGAHGPVRPLRAPAHSDRATR